MIGEEGRDALSFPRESFGSLTSLRSSLGSMVEAWGNSSGSTKEKCLMLMITGSINVELDCCAYDPCPPVMPQCIKCL
jgi:hypothetical protein